MTLPATLRVTHEIAIPRRELQFSFVRSSGPGGQNVNKVASKAVLRWHVAGSAAISDEVRHRLLIRERRRINEQGKLILTSQRYRDQPRNVEDCLQKFSALVAAAAKRPRTRKKTRPTKASKESRLELKRATAAKKRDRRLPRSED